MALMAPPCWPSVGTRQELVIKLRQDLAQVEMAGAAVFDFRRRFHGVDTQIRTMFPVTQLAKHGHKAKPAHAKRDGGQNRELPIAYLNSFLTASGEHETLNRLLEEVVKHPEVETAYIKPSTYLAGGVTASRQTYKSQQGYLGAAPDGIDCPYAWKFNGGTGKGVRVIDIEGDWNTRHVDLKKKCKRQGTGKFKDLEWRNHGTAVLGEFAGSKSDGGVIGIAPDAEAHCYSINDFGESSATAITTAAANMQPGDILLIELHRPGPRYDYGFMPEQDGYFPVEWFEDDRIAVWVAVSLGIIVVAAAGNGNEDLDDRIYNFPKPGFPHSWHNPFRRGDADTGSILVAAGAPPSGNFGPDRSRLDFSNHGSAIDAQGWGREVVTCGYGDLLGGSNENNWYTAEFSGTSSAAPIVVGALACVQGILKASGQSPLTPQEARNLLRQTGTPSQPDRSRSQFIIGNRPDLRQLVPAALALR